MNIQETTRTGPTSLTIGRSHRRVGSEYDRPDPLARRFQERTTPLVDRRESTVERALPSRAERADGLEVVLSGPQFQGYVQRERSLADRGTRRFSLLVLRRRSAEAGGRRQRAALAQLARQVSRRLRSTDLVGRTGAERVEILLTDTEPAGSQVVAAWVEQLAAGLGLDLERTIHVYPSVVDPSADQGLASFPRNGKTNGATNGHATPAAQDGAATNGKTAHGPLNGHAQRSTPAASWWTPALAPPAGWPMEDLWPHLDAPTPPWKRALDILFSALALLVLSPLFVLIALAIRLDSPGPVIFRQRRAGRAGRPFLFYKFRSMVLGAEEGRAALADQNEQSGPIFKIRHDPRITRPGRWLRRWSLDELPQLWNVLKGDISLVGPRSPTFDEVEKYERWQRRRLCITGGITCFWQVSGRSEIPFRDWMRLDLRYVACRNLWVDLKILALTLPAVISGRGAC